MRDPECAAFLQWAAPRLHIRWQGFRRVRGQVCKRIARRIQALDLPGEAAYRTYLEAHPAEWLTLDAMCRVTISRFYRDRAIFEALERQILPSLVEQVLARGGDTLRCWSAGTASGEEAYTLMTLLRLTPGLERVRPRVLATDIDEQLLERARRGCYASGTLRELPRPLFDRAFTRSGELHSIRPELREGIEFRQEDIRERQPDERFDLVLCRNLVFTYFEPDLQARLLRAIAARIAPGGFLVIGSHESLPDDTAGLSPWNGHRSIFRSS